MYLRILLFTLTLWSLPASAFGDCVAADPDCTSNANATNQSSEDSFGAQFSKDASALGENISTAASDGWDSVSAVTWDDVEEAGNDTGDAIVDGASAAGEAIGEGWNNLFGE